MAIASRAGLLLCLEKNCRLPPEVEEGNVEYKLKLRPGNEQRKNQLISQLQWRLTEHGECFYMLGYRHQQPVLEESIRVLKELCSCIGAVIVNVETRKVKRKPELYAAEVCVKLIVSKTTSVRRMVKITFLGESGSGKSTLVGVLASSSLDNGKGSIRLSLLRHRHEVISGRTSSAAIEFLPFDEETRQPIRHVYEGMDPIPLLRQKQLLGTARVAQLIDLPGDVRYQKVTFSALTSWAAPDWICLVVPATATIDDFITEDLLSTIIGLELPFFVVINKMDLVDSQKSPLPAAEISDLITKIRKDLFGQAISPYTVSIIKCSCITGEGIDNLTNNLSRLHQRQNLRMINYLLTDGRFPNSAAIFCVEGIQVIPDVGIVLSGTVIHGVIDIDVNAVKTFVGPTKDGRFVSISVKSAHRMRLPVHSISAGQMVTLAIDGVAENELNRGMLLMTYYNDSVPSPLNDLVLPMVNRVEADVVGSCRIFNSMSDAIKGFLYYMGSKWNARLISLHTFHGKVKRRATFELIDSLVSLLPGTRLIFVGPDFRIQGFVLLN